MNKEVTPGMIIAAVVVLLVLLGGAYWLFGRSQGGPDNSDQYKPGMKPVRPHVSGGGGGASNGQ